MRAESVPLNVEMIGIEKPNAQISYYVNERVVKWKAKKLCAQCCIAMSWVVILCLLASILFLVWNILIKGKPCTGQSNEMLRICCPNLDDDKCQFRIDRFTGKCYKIGNRGPCSRKMIFDSQTHHSAFGQCFCEYQNTNRSLIYDPEVEKCFFIFEQGSCEPGEWITIKYKNKMENSDPIAICEKSSCSKDSTEEESENSEMVPIPVTDANGTESFNCAKLNQPTAFCPEPKSNYKIGFTADSIFPKCVPMKFGNENFGNEENGPKMEAYISWEKNWAKSEIQPSINLVKSEETLNRFIPEKMNSNRNGKVFIIKKSKPNK